MTKIANARRVLAERVLQGSGVATHALRRAAFDNAGLEPPWRGFVDKVIEHSAQVTDDDVRAMRDAGQSEDQIFEVVVCAALGEATREYDAAMAALDAVEKE